MNPVLKFRDLSNTLLKPQVVDKGDSIDTSASKGTRADALEVLSDSEDMMDDDIVDLDEEDDGGDDDEVDDDENSPEPVIAGQPSLTPTPSTGLISATQSCWMCFPMGQWQAYMQSSKPTIKLWLPVSGPPERCKHRPKRTLVALI